MKPYKAPPVVKAAPGTMLSAMYRQLRGEPSGGGAADGEVHVHGQGAARLHEDQGAAGAGQQIPGEQPGRASLPAGDSVLTKHRTGFVSLQELNASFYQSLSHIITV